MDTEWLAALRRDAGAIRTLGDLATTCHRVRESLELEYYCFGLRLPTSFVDARLIVLDDYPEAFRAFYEEFDGLRIDPVLLRTYQQAGPVFWDEVFAAQRKGTPSAGFVSGVRGMGLRAGVSCGFRGVGGEFTILSLGTSGDDQAAREHVRAVASRAMLAGALLHDVGARLSREEVPVGLTPRERECLVWCAEGYNAPDFARRLGIAERTVVFHLRNAIAKLGASTRQQAVARAVAFGVVEPKALSMPGR